MSTLADEVKALKADLSIEYNPYFASLADGSFSREDFIETQIQFLFAVVFVLTTPFEINSVCRSRL